MLRRKFIGARLLQNASSIKIKSVRSNFGLQKKLMYAAYSCPKLINVEVGINGEDGKNTAIRNFIEIKSSNDLVKVSIKGTLEIQR